MAVGMSASSVRMEMLIAPVARFAAMKTGNMFKLMAAKICDIGRVKLPDKQAQDTCGRSLCRFRCAGRTRFARKTWVHSCNTKQKIRHA